VFFRLCLRIGNFFRGNDPALCQFVWLNTLKKGKIMTSTSDKIKGAANEAMGKAKQAAGSAVDDPKMRAKGAAQEVKGKAQKTVGGAKDEVKKAVDGD
jgi:uncharacterized protein YjbJ (UPF0337 family)